MLTQVLLAPCLPSACSVASLLCHNNNLIAIEHLARTMHLCVIRCAVDSGRFGDNKVQAGSLIKLKLQNLIIIRFIWQNMMS